MIVLGLLLIVLAGGSAVWLVMASESIRTPIDLTAWGVTIGFTPLALIVTGAAVLLVLWLGLGLIRGSVRRRRKPAREAKSAQRQAEVEENIRADERARAEETHQSTLADRDRVKDEEYQSRLAQHDQERDEEFARRQADEEQRIRADERARVEAEHQSRSEAATSAPATEQLAPVAGDSEATPAPDAEGAPTAAATDAAVDGRATENGKAHGDGNAAPDEGSDDMAEEDAASGRHRTVADEIMGRGGPAT